MLRKYSRDEISVFVNKCIKQDMIANADFATMVSLGIGASFGGSNKINKVLEEMRK